MAQRQAAGAGKMQAQTARGRLVFSFLQTMTLARVPWKHGVLL